MLCVNKCDRAITTAKDRLEEGQVENEMFDLLCALNANDDQLEYSTLYASAKEGWAVEGEWPSLLSMVEAHTILLSYSLLATRYSPLFRSPLCSSTTFNPSHPTADPSEIEDAMSSTKEPGFEISKGMEPLLRELVDQVPAPSLISVDGVEGEGDDERDGDDAPFRFTVNNLSHDQFIGTLLTGKVHSGSAKVGDAVRVLPRGTEGGVVVSLAGWR